MAHANGHTSPTDPATSAQASQFFGEYDWQPQPAAQKLVLDIVAEFLARNAPAAAFAKRLKDETGTRFHDWIDHIAVGSGDRKLRDGIESRLTSAGFELAPQPGADKAYVQRKGMFPEIVLDTGAVTRIALKVEFVADFVATHGLHDARILGRPGGQLRMASFLALPGAELWVIERHGMRGYADPSTNATPAELSIRAQEHLENFRRRKRECAPSHEADIEALLHTSALADKAIADIGRDWTCDAFYAAEREFWTRRNRAAQVQFARQRSLGMGWANHDHHTYRSSRHTFPHLVALWEKLGLRCRERFYAGAEAGWGAQVMEQPVTGIITFNDVDMSPEELFGDFSHKGFSERRDKLGTVGLWCGLHGEAVLQSGMHHLEAQFDWHALVEQLETSAGVKTMAPFTTFAYLRQAFTEGERWRVDGKRIDRLLEERYITPAQAELFRKDGAIGSHLENLERNDGFKGFNQTGVSDIIARTDPRRLAAALAGA